MGEKKPIIHFITNYVTMNDVANTSIAMGNSPIMAEAIEEVTEIYPFIDGLVVNLGTINPYRCSLIEAAMKEATLRSIPILLDPVGVAISKYRLDFAKRLLDTYPITVLKMNGMEAVALLEGKISDLTMGIDSPKIDGSEFLQDMDEVVQKIYTLYFRERFGAMVIITAQEDRICYGEPLRVKRISGGSILQRGITGSGCMLNGVLMSYLVGKQSPELGLIHMNRAAQLAERKVVPFDSLEYKRHLLKQLGFLQKRVYLISDDQRDFETETLPKTEAALGYGVDLFQYRPKRKTDEEKRYEGMRLRTLCRKYGTIFIVNDDPYLAQELQADGVHLGIQDMAIREARKILGEKAIIGATAKTLEQAICAEEAGADYLGIGAVFPSTTKKSAIAISREELEKLFEHRRRFMLPTIPIYGIGGIDVQNVEQLVPYFDGIAMVSGIYDSKDPESDIKQCKNIMKEK